MLAYNSLVRITTILALVTLASAPALAEDPTTPRLDLSGDPLPEGAIARLGTLRWRHAADVTFVAFTQGDKQVLTSCGDGLIHVWDARSGKPIRTFGKKRKIHESEGGAVIPPVDEEFPLSRVKIAASADGKLLAMSVSGAKIQVWDVAAGKEVRTIEHGQDGLFPGFVFTEDGRRLVTCASIQRNSPEASVQRVKVWDLATGTLAAAFTPPEETEGSGSPDRKGSARYVERSPVVVSPDGKLGLDGKGTLSDDDEAPTIELRVWNMKERKVVARIKQAMLNGRAYVGYIVAPVFAPDCKRLAWERSDGTICLYDVATGKEVQKLGQLAERPSNESMIMRLVFSPDGKTLAALHVRSEVSLYDLSTGKELRKVGEKPVKEARGQGSVEIAHEPRLAYGSSVWTSSPEYSLAWSADGKTIAQPQHNLLRLWNVEDGKGNDLAGGHVGRVTGLLPAADARTALTVGKDNTIRQWDVGTSKERRKVDLPGDTQQCVLLAPDRALILNQWVVHVYDPTEGKDVLALGGSAYEEYAGRFRTPALICASANRKIVAFLDSEVLLRVFAMQSGKELQTILLKDLSVKGMQLTEQVCALACSTDGRTMAVRIDTGAERWNRRRASGEDAPQIKSTVRLYESDSARLLWESPMKKPDCRALAFSPNGHSIAVIEYTDDGVALLEAATGRERLHLTLSGVALAFSPEGQFLAIGSAEGTVKVVDLRTAREIAAFHGHLGEVSSLAFSGDAGALFTGDNTGTVLVWNVRKQTQKAKAQLTLDTGALANQWSDLVDTDPVKAFRAVAILSAAPKQAVHFLAEHLQPAKVVEEERIDKLIALLDSEEFETRRNAVQELGKAGERARDALKEVLENNPSPELTRLVEQALAWLEPGNPVPDVLREIRAVEVLETIGTPEARALLEKLAKGARSARLTREAKAALRRLGPMS